MECIGLVFVRNGALTSCKNFDSSYLDKPAYVYEVFRVIDGIALFLEDHFARLLSSCQLSSVDFLLDFSIFREQVYSLISANSLTIGNIKVVVLQNNNREFETNIFFTEHQYPTEDQFDSGVELALMDGIRRNPNAKVMDVSLRSKANALKQSRNVYETLLVDQDGFITEGSRSNVFFVRKGEVITPPLADVLPGITRKHILDVCKTLGLPVKEEKVATYAINEIEGVFISGTSRKVLPANRIDNLCFDARHPVINKIKAGFNEMVKNYIMANKFFHK